MFKFFALPVALACAAALAQADTYEIVKADSVFSIVTHKGGIAAAMAHNHIVFPTDYDAEMAKEGDGPDAARFSLTFPVSALTSDTPEAQKKWYPSIAAAGILDEPFVAVSEKDRASIKETMLSDKQLDAAKHPQISAKILRLREDPFTRGKTKFTHKVTLSFSVHGKTLEKEIPARIELTGDTLKVEATGEYKFTDFGIKPYSAMAGAVKNKDNFDFYINLTAKKK